MATHELATHELASLAQSGKPLFGIHESNGGKVVIFGSTSRRSWALKGAMPSADGCEALCASARY